MRGGVVLALWDIPRNQDLALVWSAAMRASGGAYLSAQHSGAEIASLRWDRFLQGTNLSVVDSPSCSAHLVELFLFKLNVPSLGDLITFHCLVVGHFPMLRAVFL